MPKISIIVPNYNSGIYIQECLKSLLSQTYKNFEIIIVDDCSTDESIPFLKRIDNNKIRVVYNKENVGASEARNIGVSLSTGEFVGFVDADDRVDNEWLENIVAKITQEDLDVCGCWMKTFNSKKNIVYKTSEKYKDIREELWFIGGNIGGLVVRKNICTSIPFDTSLSLHEDKKFYISILALTKKVSNVQKTLYFYRRHEQNATKMVSDINFSSNLLLPTELHKYKNYIITLGANPSLKNICWSVYIGCKTLKIRLLPLYFLLTWYYALQK